jgi:hypothetical protein
MAFPISAWNNEQLPVRLHLARGSPKNVRVKDDEGVQKLSVRLSLKD